MKTAAQRATEWFWCGSRCHDMAERSKVKKQKQVFACRNGWRLRQTQPLCSCMTMKKEFWNRERRGVDEHWAEIKDGEFKKLVNKDGTNETYQWDRAIMTGVNNSMRAEISNLIVFNLFSGYASVSPSSHYQRYYANETILCFLCCTDTTLEKELKVKDEYRNRL